MAGWEEMMESEDGTPSVSVPSEILQQYYGGLSTEEHRYLRQLSDQALQELFAPFKRGTLRMQGTVLAVNTDSSCVAVTAGHLYDIVKDRLKSWMTSEEPSFDQIERPPDEVSDVCSTSAAGSNKPESESLLDLCHQMNRSLVRMMQPSEITPYHRSKLYQQTVLALQEIQTDIAEHAQLFESASVMHEGLSLLGQDLLKESTPFLDDSMSLHSSMAHMKQRMSSAKQKCQFAFAHCRSPQEKNACYRLWFVASTLGNFDRIDSQLSDWHVLLECLLEDNGLLDDTMMGDEMAKLETLVCHIQKCVKEVRQHITPTDDILGMLRKVNRKFHGSFNIFLEQESEMCLNTFKETQVYQSCKHKLQQFYINNLENCQPVPLMPELSFSATHTWVDLHLVHHSDNKSSRAEQAATDEASGSGDTGHQRVLLDALSQRHVVVVDGDPGAGKTTLIKKIASEWARAGFGGYDLVLVAHLHEVHYADSVLEVALKWLRLHIPYYDWQRVMQALSSTHTYDEGLKVLVMLDNLDESVCECDELANTLHSTAGVILPFDLLIAARPFKAHEIRCPRWTVTIQGLNENQIRHYIRNQFPRDGESLVNGILHLTARHPTLRALASKPLLLTFMCIVYKEKTHHRQHDRDASMQKDIFESIFQSLIGRFYQKIEPSTADFFPPCNPALVLNEHQWQQNEEFLKLGRLALDGLTSDLLCTRLTFTQQELDNYCINDEIFCQMGLLMRESTISGKIKFNVKFPHKSFQQFMAAVLLNHEIHRLLTEENEDSVDYLLNTSPAWRQLNQFVSKRMNVWYRFLSTFNFLLCWKDFINVRLVLFFKFVSLSYANQPGIQCNGRRYMKLPPYKWKGVHETLDLTHLFSLVFSQAVLPANSAAIKDELFHFLLASTATASDMKAFAGVLSGAAMSPVPQVMHGVDDSSCCRQNDSVELLRLNKTTVFSIEYKVLLCANCIEQLVPNAVERNISTAFIGRIGKHFHHIELVWCEGDSDRITQLLSNLTKWHTKSIGTFRLDILLGKQNTQWALPLVRTIKTLDIRFTSDSAKASNHQAQEDAIQGVSRMLQQVETIEELKFNGRGKECTSLINLFQMDPCVVSSGAPGPFHATTLIRLFECGPMTVRDLSACVNDQLLPSLVAVSTYRCRLDLVTLSYAIQAFGRHSHFNALSLSNEPVLLTDVGMSGFVDALVTNWRQLSLLAINFTTTQDMNSKCLDVDKLISVAQGLPNLKRLVLQLPFTPSEIVDRIQTALPQHIELKVA